ncbi:MAG: hypothetical protein WAL61_17075 [Acidimicrobiales bacterium]
MPVITGIHVVGIPAGDQDRALTFYGSLGFETGVRLTTDDVLRWPGVPPMFAFRDQDGNGLRIVEA